MSRAKAQTSRSTPAPPVRAPRVTPRQRHDDTLRNPLARMEPTALATLADELHRSCVGTGGPIERRRLTNSIWKDVHHLSFRMPGANDAWEQYCDVHNAISRLPQGGRWLEAVETVHGAIEHNLIAAAYLLGFTLGKAIGGK